MKRIILARVRGSEIITSAHKAMFHGEAFRDGVSYPFSASATWFNDVRTPLELVHSKQVLPDIFQPAENLIVSPQVADLLKDIFRVDFLPVKFDKLVDFSFEKGSKQGKLTGSEIDLLSLPDDPEARKRLPAFYEVLVPKDRELAETDPEITRIEVDVEPAWDDPLDLKYSPEMLAAHPLLRASIYHLFEPALFSKIEPFLDRDYFLTKQVELG